MRPVLVAGIERLLDQQAAKTGAIDEQVALDDRTVGEHHRFHVAALAVDFGVDDLSFDPAHAAVFSIVAQECRIQAGIEVERVVETRQRRPRVRARTGVAAHRGRHGAHRPGRNVRHRAALALAKVELVEMHPLQVLREAAEGVEIALADVRPS